jgi:hypothetical protein
VLARKVPVCLFLRPSCLRERVVSCHRFLGKSQTGQVIEG